MYHFCVYICPIKNEQRTMETKHTIPDAFNPRTSEHDKVPSLQQVEDAWRDGYNACLERTAAKELFEAAQIALAEIKMKNAHFGMYTSTATEALRAAIEKATEGK